MSKIIEKTTTTTTQPSVVIDAAVVASPFVAETYKTTLRVTCYGSSSAATPERYLQEARSLGYILAKRNHICVNGAGQYGCMAALNDGAVAGNGHLVGVIHEMFLVDNGDHVDGQSYVKNKGQVQRDGSAHSAFYVDGSSKKEPSKKNDQAGPIREILVAGGDDLQERKRLLVKNADALVVLPGGPGTWDEVSRMI
jgi:predicted Rossmann-fold nucleotide-binding protein